MINETEKNDKQKYIIQRDVGKKLVGPQSYQPNLSAFSNKGTVFGRSQREEDKGSNFPAPDTYQIVGDF